MPNPSSSLLDRLATALVMQMGLEECPNTANLIAPSRLQRGFIRPKHPLRLAGYYDLQPGALIYDAAGGTLALVEYIPPSAGIASMRSAIDQAASVRQLLLEQAELESRGPQRTGPRKVALQVELVILTEAPTADSETPLRQVLTDIARQTGYVRLIGIGVLQPDSKGAFSDAALRRAFPWLLTATHKWFQRPDFSNANDAWRTPGQPFELRLHDYRIAGTRRLRCDGNCNLQIVHGHNGSGKSALTEALELLLTNSVQRVIEGGETDYFSSVRHRPAGTDNTLLRKMPPAEVSLWNGSAAPPAATPVSSVVIGPDGIVRSGKLPHRLLHANSFRLDQNFMDKIVRNRPEQRAGIFLDAFSPSDVELLPKLRANRKALDDGIAALPQQIATTAPTEQTLLFPWVLNQFGWLRAPAPATASGAAPAPATASGAATPPPASPPTPATASGGAPPPPNDAAARKAALEAVLPMPLDELKILTPLYGPLAGPVTAIESVSTRDELASALREFDKEIPALLKQLPVSLHHLRTALRVFEEFRTWNAHRRLEHGASFKADLDSWLEALALHDLALKGHQIVCAFSDAARNSWPVPEADAEIVRVLQNESLRSHLASRLDALIGQVNAARSSVQGWLEPKTGGQNAEPAAAPEPSRRHSLSREEIPSLNLAGKWLASAGFMDGLGATFNAALGRSEETPLAKATIGKSGGLDPAIAETRQAIAACERLQSATAGNAPSTSERLQKLSGLVAAVDIATDLAKDLPNSFFQILAGSDSGVLNDLIAAFNELLALMTPARWTYRDIQLGVQMSTGDASVALTTYEGARADLLFNTAELNAWTLTLFLLLAPRLPNSLYLLVLDDPLQNMDELTVITVARALSHLTRIYPQGWQILALFHGEDSVARVLDETQAIVYELPWMQPTSASSDDTIVPVHTPEKWPPDLQQLTAKFLADPVAPAVLPASK